MSLRQTMPDMEKVIKAIDICLGHGKCDDCSYHSGANYSDQNCRGRMLQDVLAMLKEQEAVKPVLDEQTGRIWLCGKCGSYVGFEDNDPHDPNEYDKHCRECGRPVLWEGR